MRKSRDNTLKFSVIQFLKLPYEGIDDYICVPANWVVVRGGRGCQKAAVKYPKDEDKFVTRGRVRREERYDKNWEFWLAKQEYETDTFEDAEQWIAIKNNYTLLSKRDLNGDTPSTSTSNKKSRSNKQRPTSDSKKDTPELIAKTYKTTEKLLQKVTIKRPASLDIELEHNTKRGKQSSKRGSEPINAGAQPECSRRSASFADEPKIINISDEDDHLQLQQYQQPIKNIDHVQNNLVVDMTAALKHLQGSGNSPLNFRTRISSAQTLATNSSYQESRSNAYSINGPCRTQKRPELLPSISAYTSLHSLHKTRKKKLTIKAKHPDVEKKLLLKDPAAASPRSKNPPPPRRRATTKRPSPLFLNLPDSVRRTLLATRYDLLSSEERKRGNLARGLRVLGVDTDEIDDDQNSGMQSQMTDDKASSEIAEDAILEPPSHVTHTEGNSGFVSEQRTMNHGATASARMSPTFGTVSRSLLETSILEIVEMLLTLLENMKNLNSSENVESLASTSRNASHRIPTVVKERKNAKTESSYYSNVGRDRKTIDEELERNPSSTSQLNLPPEYDPTDTSWTLKYDEDRPGLRELLPHTHIYVNYGNLQFWEKMSTNCPSLARRVLREVFSENALSVCSSMTEREPNGRPRLDERGCAVLIDYVLGHGVKCGWRTDLQPILIALDHAVKSMRLEFRHKFRSIPASRFRK